ncbi:MAG: site-specific DNA-methyltransferase [Chloroflexi bacterium]|nr:site-specific DNA-methyltransferase [Chloroflexota bacterium]
MAELVWDGKYDKEGKKVAPLRVALPFQTVETVNESAQERQMGLDAWARGRTTEWRNRLIWGDKKYVLPSLLPEFAGKVDLIYIDPPFDTGADFSFQVQVDGEGFTKEPSIIEQKAYRDTWGGGLDSYLHWFYETAVILREMLAETGSIYVHLDWHVGHYAKTVLDEVFGTSSFTNEIIWYYYNKFQGNINRFASNHDVILYYRKSGDFTFYRQKQQREAPTRQLKRAWDKEVGRIVNAKDAEGHVMYQDVVDQTVDDVWRIPMLQPADQTENVRYPTQKREAILERIVNASSNEDDLVLDCFVGSGTTAAVAERLGRRWIACDLGRFAIHTTRKRLLAIGAKPFIVQNLGKYERQLWQAAEFGDEATAKVQAYRSFILELYHATPISGYAWLHGVKAGRMVHVGAVDSPVSPGDITQIAAEFRRAVGTGKDAPTTNGVDVLGWDFAFELNEVAKQHAEQANINLRFLRIPREVLEKKAVEQGDIRFFELAALSVDVATKGRAVTLTLTDFVIPPDDVPEDVRQAIKHWAQWVDYWAVDWDNKGDTFHNQWQAYRTRKSPDLQKSIAHTYDAPGEYAVVVKVIDILGNDTTKTLKVTVR